MPKTIRQRVTIKASPTQVYDVLMDSKKHSSLSGAPAKISRTVGGSYTAGGDYMWGKNRELVPGKRIVQTWIAADFPKGHESKITFNLKKVKSGTLLSFYHSNVPAKTYKTIKSGWLEYYWSPLKKMFEKK